MINYIWAGMIVLSLLSGLFSGNIETITKGAIDGCTEGVSLCVSLLGIMCFWTGISKIAEKSGLIEGFARLIRPITKILFPRLKEGSEALSAIVMNMVANFFGMGNAATPLGIKAMKELDKINGRKDASNEMCTFAVINTASIQLIPSTIISLRQTFGSEDPGAIIVPIWIASVVAVTVAVISTKIFEKRKRL
ncbi:MAG: nucleoside recognition protein [Clostridia bacterium]|nr:nucleoside recognition protein [Clostridia bacterium]